MIWSRLPRYAGATFIARLSEVPMSSSTTGDSTMGNSTTGNSTTGNSTTSNSTMMQLSRRHLLAGASASVALSAMAVPAYAKAPLQNTPAPGFYRFKIGAFEATVVSDGPLDLGEPKDGVFQGLSKDDMVRGLADNFLPVDNVRMEQNALLINTGDRLALLDTGCGASRMFGQNSGRLLANLKAAGIDPKDIDAIVLTHAHPDHCWGLTASDGVPHFINAQIYMAQSDLEFWTDESKAT